MRLRHAIVAALGCAFALAHQCSAQLVLPANLETATVTLPQPDASGRTNFQGLSADISVSRQFGVGYAEVQIDVGSTTGVLGATRQLSLRLKPYGRHLPSDGALTAEIPFEFEQGTNRVQVTAMIPKWTLGNGYRIELAEDDVVLDDHVAEVGTSFTASAARAPDRVLARDAYHDMLFLDTTATRAGKYFSRTEWQVKSISDLPSDWRAMRDINTIVVPYSKLVASRGSAAFETLRHWTLSGGTLVLLDGPEATQIGEDLRLALVFVLADRERLTGIRFALGQETKAALNQYEELLVTLQEGQNTQNTPTMVPVAPLPNGMGVRPPIGPSSPEDQRDVEEIVDTLLQADGAHNLRWKQVTPYRAGAGMVLPVTTADINSYKAIPTLEQFSGHRDSATLHRGVDPVLGDVRHQRWLIPGVAQPPVYAFMGALTLFVILVGPVAYRMTSKAERSHLMFLIAPVLALLTTITMFSYSVVSDGFGTTTRIRQLTFIDGASGDAFERTRSTLFAGISPRAGVQFPADAEVMLYRAGGQRSWNELPGEVKDIRFNATVTPETQRFGSSVLPSRAQRQFVSHRILPKLGAVTLKDVPIFDTGAKAPPAGDATAVSSLPFDLESLIIRSTDGRYWFAERAPGDAETKVAWIANPTEASKRLGDIYNRHRLVSATAATRSGQSRRDVGDLIVFINRMISRQSVPITEGTLELQLNQMLFVTQELPFGSFVALAAPSEDSVAVDGAEVVESVRYVMGTLQ
ncbi:MAG: hypothetical protein AAFU85_00165 [Planctomycetota bacterium]